MNSKLQSVLIVGFTLALGLSANLAVHAQGSAPKPPYVKLPPAGTTWSVDVRTKEETSPKPAGVAGDQASQPEGTTTNGTKDTSGIKMATSSRVKSYNGSNGVRRVETQLTDGRREEYYVVGSREYRKFENTDGVGAYSAGVHFPATEWLGSGSRYVGEETIDKTPCHRFDVRPDYLAKIPLPETTKWTAWINVENGYPVKVQYGDEIYQFSPVIAWSQAVELPPAFKKALETEQKQERALKALKLANQGK